MTWFLVVVLLGANCPGKCEPAPAMTILMPSEEICMQVRDLNADRRLECWAKQGGK